MKVFYYIQYMQAVRPFLYYYVKVTMVFRALVQEELLTHEKSLILVGITRYEICSKINFFLLLYFVTLNLIFIPVRRS